MHIPTTCLYTVLIVTEHHHIVDITYCSGSSGF